MCLAGIVGVWLALSLLAWAIVPPLVKWQGERRLTAVLGRSVTLGQVSFNPWRLDLVTRDLRVASAGPRDASDTSAPLLTIARVRLDLSVSSVVELAPVIEALDIDTARLRLTRLADGHYDIDDVIRRVLAPASNSASPSRPARFALYNLQLRDVAVHFDDRPAARVHEVTALDLAVPFISDLPAQIDVKVTPRLSFRLNGVPFRSDGFATPFASTRSGELHLAVQALDLAPYAGYLPSSMPARLEKGLLTADLVVGFSAPDTGASTLAVHGSAGLRDARFVDADGNALAGWRSLEVDVRSVEPLARRIALTSLRLDGADVRVERAADGSIDLPRTRAQPPAGPVSAASSVASAPRATVPPAPAPWRFELDRLDVSDTSLVWNDVSVQPPVALLVDGLKARADRLRWPLAAPIELSAEASVRRQGEAGVRRAHLTVRGSASDQSARLRLAVAGLPLNAFEGYWAQRLVPRVEGLASAEAQVEWSRADGAGGRTRVTIDSASVAAPSLRMPGADTAASASPASMQRLGVIGARLDTGTREVSIEQLTVDAPALALTRGRDGLLDASRWVIPSPAPDAPTVPPWRVEIRQTLLTGGRLQWTDASVAGNGSALRLAVTDLRVALQTLSWEGSRPAVPAHFEASGRVGAPSAPGDPEPKTSGGFEWRGVVGVAPLEVIGQLKAERLPVHRVLQYAGLHLPVRIAHVELGIDGQLSVRQLPAGLDVDGGADLLLGAVRVDTAAAAGIGASETLLSWNTLAMKGVRVAVKPNTRPKLDIAQATLDNFATRLAVTEDGRLNLREVAAGSAPEPAAPASAPGAGLPIDVRIGETLLTNGRIDFSDHFVRPNYSAALTRLDGRLGTLDTANPAMAALSLRGQAAGTAQLEIEGTVDPLARPPSLDLHAKATDLELAPLTPYAGKYAGYAIERGKLSMELAYRLGADGKLDATNRVVLNQLTFGQKIDSPAATTLPVLLAVALLKDRNGIIDLDLPIRGSLDDPQFSIGALIGRLLGSLLLKAVTSPFALLTHGAGAGEGTAEDPGRVRFVAGTARLDDTGAAAVETVAQALSSKPRLLLTVTGTADAAREQDAYRSAELEDRIEAERRTETVAAATAASAPQPPLSTAARERLVRRLYRETELPDKPRNVFGLASELPSADMEARLKAAIDLTPDAVRALALQRGVTVRDALVASGLPGERLFLAAPKADAAGADTGWQPEARLALTPR